MGEPPVPPDEAMPAMNCPRCGAVNAVYVVQCSQCGAPLQAMPPPLPSTDIGQDPAMRLLLPVGRSGLAIAAGYAGLFAMLCLPAPIALVLGLLAIRDIKRHPEKHGLGRAIFGVVMGGIFTALLLLQIVLLAMGAVK
jgi:hypothetical protein